MAEKTSVSHLIRDRLTQAGPEPSLKESTWLGKLKNDSRKPHQRPDCQYGVDSRVVRREADQEDHRACVETELGRVHRRDTEEELVAAKASDHEQHPRTKEGDPLLEEIVSPGSNRGGVGGD